MKNRSCRSLFHLALILLLAAGSGCVHKHTSQKTGPLDPGLLTLQGTILNKSSRLQTFLLTTGQGRDGKERRIRYDFRTRGMEYMVSGRKVTVTCKRADKHGITCKALTIVPAECGYPEDIKAISSRDLKKKIDAHRDITLVDTRPLQAYQACHIPGALSLPACATDAAARLRRLDHDTTLILYCGWPDCNGSLSLAKKALADADNPFEEIRILAKGLDGWVREGMVTVASDRFILAGKPVLIDLRPVRKNAGQRIPGAISIPLAMLGKRISTMPAGAPVVIYGNSLQESMEGLALFRKKGFGRIAMVAGDLHGWKNRGNPVTSGPPSTAIRWQRQPAAGEVRAAVLRKDRQRADVIVLDLRSDAERRQQGTIRGSRPLPLASLYGQMDSLDREKTIYCLSGARGALASEILNARGFTALYLSDSALSCNGRSCEVR